MTTIPSTAMVRDAIDAAGRLIDLTPEEFDAWLTTHDATLRSKVLVEAADAYKAAFFPPYTERWLRNRAGEAHRTFGEDWL